MALIIAVLYFGLMELMMIDSSRALAEARRFRARIVATTLAENAAELAAMHVATPGVPKSVTPPLVDDQGTMRWAIQGSPEAFQIRGEGETTGIVVTRAVVEVAGRVEEGKIVIERTIHSQ